MMWDTSYRAGAVPWLRKELNPAFRLWFDDAKVGRLRDVKVLVPGCGTSLEPLEFARLGAEVTCIDIAATAIDIQQRNFASRGLKARFVCADFAVWQPNETYDLVYEQTCLCAILPSERAAYESFVERTLRPGGLLYALFMQTNSSGGPPYHCGIDEMRRVFPEKHWRWLSGQGFRSNHPLGVHELGFVLERL